MFLDRRLRHSFLQMVLVLAAVAACVSAQLVSGITGNHQQGYYQSYQDPYLAQYPRYYTPGHQDLYHGVQQQHQQQMVYPEVHQRTIYPGVQQLNFARGAVNSQAQQVDTVGQNTAVPLDYNYVPVTPVPIESQHQSLDEYGRYSFGFTGGDLGRYETRDAYGNVQGSYNYVDSEGQLQTQHYVADELGFRVVGTNLPKSPEVSAVPSAVAIPAVVTVPPLKPVTDTPEVAAAKAAFVKAYNKAALAAHEATDEDVTTESTST